MLHLETVAASTLELLKELQGLDSLRETRLVGGTTLLKSLTYFDDAEIDISPSVLDLNINWTNIKSTITNEVKQLV